MKHSLAVAAIAALAFGAAHAADTPAPTDKNALAAADKAGTKAAEKKMPAAKKTDAAKAAAPPAAAASATDAPAKVDSGLEAASARARPATGATPMTGTRGIPKPAPPADKPAADAAPAPAKQ